MEEGGGLVSLNLVVLTQRDRLLKERAGFQKQVKRLEDQNKALKTRIKDQEKMIAGLRQKGVER